MEKGQDGKVKEHYIDPLADVIETYVKLKDSNVGIRSTPIR
ncbi:putative integrase [Sulfolobus acidocaldarius]